MKIIPLAINVLINLIQNNTKYAIIYSNFENIYYSELSPAVWYEKKVKPACCSKANYSFDIPPEEEIKVADNGFK